MILRGRAQHLRVARRWYICRANRGRCSSLLPPVAPSTGPGYRTPSSGTFIKLRPLAHHAQTLNIRSRLSALTFATLLPIAIFGAVGAYMLVQRERDSFERGALDRVRALMTAIDAEFRASITPLEMLARSPALDRDDLAAFRAEAERALQARRGDWSNVLVSNADTAERLMDLLVPPGAPLPKTLDPGSVLGSAKSGKPTIGNVVTGPILNRPVFAVRVPVMRDGKAKYVLSGVIETSVIDGLVERQAFPGSWAVAVVDGSYSFVVRRPLPETGIGAP